MNQCAKLKWLNRYSNHRSSILRFRDAWAEGPRAAHLRRMVTGGTRIGCDESRSVEPRGAATVGRGIAFILTMNSGYIVAAPPRRAACGVPNWSARSGLNPGNGLVPGRKCGTVPRGREV